jgi:hypothetical protein
MMPLQAIHACNVRTQVNALCDIGASLPTSSLRIDYDVPILNVYKSRSN